MADAMQILGVSASAGPEEIRRKYLEQVKRFPPERDPGRFAEIRRAYDELSDPVQQVQNLIMEVNSIDAADSIDSIVNDLHARLRKKRIPTELLLSLAKD